MEKLRSGIRNTVSNYGTGTIPTITYLITKWNIKDCTGTTRTEEELRMTGGQVEKAAEAGGTSVEDRLEQLEAELQTCREELRLVVQACLIVLVPSVVEPEP
jgi:hypothetical protein